MDPESFSDVGILVHAAFTPTPLEYGSVQACKVGVPWPNEVFYYALVAIDDAGNRSPISNVISAYIYEAPTTTTTTTTTTEAPNDSVDGSPHPFLSETEIVTGKDEITSRTRVYVATGVVCGLLLLSVMVIILILVRVRTKRAQYDTDNCDSYRAYEPTPPGAKLPQNNLNNNSGNGNGNNVVKAWQSETLPRSRSQSSSSFINNNLDFLETGGTLRRNPNSSGTHTLTKTNPYRHKVLTNGSFLNLKDQPHQIHSDDGGSNSSRPTTSTEDNHSEASSGSDQQKVASVVTLRRSNTSKSFVERYGDSNVVLPPPETFGDAPHRYPIDTNTAKAIIDTYSGNLFSRSTNYYSFREKSNDEVDQDSLEVYSGRHYHERPETYGGNGPDETGLPSPIHKVPNYATLKGRLHGNPSMNKKTRTESVV